MSELLSLIDSYSGGAILLRDSISGMTAEELIAHPIPDRWSAHEVICHIADFEVINAERILRMVAEENPPIFNADPAPYVANLHYASRATDQQLILIEAIRASIAADLRGLTPVQWNRTGQHSTDGMLTVRQIVERVTSHIPHHVPFIEQKRIALNA